MDEAFLPFTWTVAKAYHWQDWLDERTRNPVLAAAEGLASLQSPSTVEVAWERAGKVGRTIGPVIGAVRPSAVKSTYAPMSRPHATLFKTFAELDYQDLDALHAFATEHGLLGVKQRTQTVPARGAVG